MLSRLAKQVLKTASFVGILGSSLLITDAYAGQVSTTYGSFNVDATGQAQYSMPIEMPAGIMGVAPQVTIHYSSAASNGLLGLGGSISGLSSITRCGSSIVQDGVVRPVKLDNEDYFCLNGQRLVLISGTYGADGATYQTQIESFQRVTSHGSIAYPGGGTGPESFTVQSKGGSKLVFGATSVERSVDIETGVVGRWSISYLEDRNGNRVDYEYEDLTTTDSNGIQSVQVLPKRIRYGRNDTMSVAGNLSVEFEFEDRPDTSTGYRRGHKVLMSKRLKHIKTKVGDDVVKDYRISYEQSPTSGASRMTELTECAGNGNCLFPVTFNWKEYDSSWTASSDTTPQALLTAQGKSRGTMVDLNRDGWVDQVVSYKQADGSVSQAVFLNSESGWQANAAYELPGVLIDYELDAEGLPTGQLVDINGDGKVDFVQAHEIDGVTTNQVYLNTGSGWQADASLPDVLFVMNAGEVEGRARFIDINYDALPDLVQSVQTAGGAVLQTTWLNSIDSGWQVSNDYQLPVLLQSFASNSNGTTLANLVDIDGDGLLDIVQSVIDTAGATHNNVWLGQAGGGWQQANQWVMPVVMEDYATSAKGINQAQLTDINGDGLLDVVQAHQFANGTTQRNTWLNTGLGWVLDNSLQSPITIRKYTASSEETTAVFMDVNNDGLRDIVRSYVNESGNYISSVWLNQGNSWSQDDSYVLPAALSKLITSQDSQSHASLLDINNDGRLDIVVSKEGEATSSWLAGVSNSSFALPELVSRFNDGLGNSHTIEYSLGIFDEVYTPDNDGAYPNIDVVGPMLLIKAVDATDGAGGIARAENHFAGRKRNLIGRGSLGFRAKTATDSRTQISVETEFYQRWPFIGSVQSFEKYSNTGILLEQSNSTFAQTSLFSDKTIYPYQNSKSSNSYELDGSLIRSETETKSLDSFGHVDQVITTVSDDDGAFTKTINNTYEHDTTSWLIGRLKTMQQTLQAPGVASITNETEYFYTGAQLIKKIIEPNHTQKVTEEYQYDGFGHRVQTTISAQDISTRTTTSTYTADGRFIASATNELGHTVLIESHEHHGKVTKTTDPNGLIELKLYNEHGLLIKTTRVRLPSDEIAHDQIEDDEGNAINVVVFHLCNPTDGQTAPNPSCPDNAVYYLSVIDNEGESPETVYYDAQSREVRKQTQGFDGTSVYVDAEFDNFGRKARTSLPYFKDDTPKWTSYEYDILGRVTGVTAPDNTLTTKSYQGNTTVVTNALGQTKTEVKDARNKAVSEIDHYGNELRYEYDAAGRLTKTIDSHNNEVVIEYDHFGRKIKQTDPDMGVWEYQYNALGQAVWQQDAKGQIATMEYDVLGRMTKRIEVEGETNWEYDTAEKGIGKLARVSDSNGYMREHTFDHVGRSIETTVTIDGEAHITEMAYLNLSDDKVDYIRYPSGLMVRKTYNEYGFPLEIRSNGLVEYQEYEVKVAEAEQYANDAIVYQNDTATERAQHVADAQSNQNIGNNYQQQAIDKQKEAQPHLQEYNSRVANVRHYVARANRYVKEAQDYARQANMHNNEVIRLTAQADLWTGYAQQYNSRHWADQADAALRNASDNAAKRDAYVVKANALAPQIQEANDKALANRNQVIAVGDVINGIMSQVQSLSSQADHYYRLANGFVKQIEAIDNEVQRLVDAADAATEKAELLLAQYEESSLLHWLAEEADAAGKILKFKQGKHVTTNVTYDENTGRLTSVLANSDASVESQNGADSYDTSIASINEWIASLGSLNNQYALEEQQATTQLQNVQQDYNLAQSNAAYYRSNNEVALALLEDAEWHRLSVEIESQQIIVSLNQQLQTLTSNALSSANSLLQTHNTESDLRVSLLNTAFYQLKSDYHYQIEQLYRDTAAAQVAKEASYRTLATQTPDDIDSLIGLSEQHVALAEYNTERNTAFINSILGGFQSSSSELVNQYTHEESLLNIENMIADVYQSRGEVYQGQYSVLAGLYYPLQGINQVVSELCALQGHDDLALHYQQNTQIGMSTLANCQELASLYLQRADTVRSESNVGALNEQRSESMNTASFSHLAASYQAKSELYLEMAEPVFWQDFFNQLGDEHTNSGDLYTQLADDNKILADDYTELMEDARNEADHSLIGFDGVVLNDSYVWDALGNLIERNHGAVDLNQTFEYDELNRLVRNDISGNGAELYELVGATTTTIEYDAIGNITYKSNAGTYTYGNGINNGAGVHAVTSIAGDVYAGQISANYTYDANGNMLTGDERSITYSSFNKPTQMSKGAEQSDFIYGPERQLIKQIATNANGTITTLSFGNAYEKIITTSDITHKYHISTAGGGVIAVLIDKENDLPRTHYLHRDHLDSIVAMTDERGFVLERFHYDAFGKRRTAVGVESDQLINTLNLNITDRGFTGHKYIAGVDVIHMKGRVYEANLGRFMSADPHVQFANNQQSYNRYSYVMNNPLTFTDPSGYFLSNIFRNLKLPFKKTRTVRKVNAVISSKGQHYRVSVKMANRVAYASNRGSLSNLSRGFVSLIRTGGFGGLYHGGGTNRTNGGVIFRTEEIVVTGSPPPAIPEPTIEPIPGNAPGSSVTNAEIAANDARNNLPGSTDTEEVVACARQDGTPCGSFGGALFTLVGSISLAPSSLAETTVPVIEGAGIGISTSTLSILAGLVLLIFPSQLGCSELECNNSLAEDLNADDFVGNNPVQGGGQVNTDIDGNGDAEGLAEDLGEEFGGPSGPPIVRPNGQISYPNGVQVRPGSITGDGRPRVNLPAGVGGPHPENIHINNKALRVY